MRAPARAHIAVNDSPMRALPHHQHILAQYRAHLLAGVQHRAGRLAHHPACQVAVVRQRRHAPLVAVDVLHKPAASPGTGQHDYALPHGELVRAALHDGARRLMAGSADSHRVLFFRMDGSVGVADVAAADRPCFKLDETFAVNYFGDIDIFDLKSFGARNSCCSHGVVTVPPKGAVPMATIGVSFEMPHYTMPQPPH